MGGPEQAVKGPRIPGEPVHPSIGTVGTPVFGVTDSRDAEHQVRRNGTSHPSGRGIAQPSPVHVNQGVWVVGDPGHHLGRLVGVHGRHSPQGHLVLVGAG